MALNYKKILYIIIISFFFILSFLIIDLFISKFTNLFHIRKNCYNYYEINQNEKNYYSYDLSKNCFAFEHKGATPSYNVYTDENGYRIGKIKKETKNKKILFLGDSFTYGFGVNYEDSVPGQFSKKLHNEYEIINLALTGYSPSMNLFKLKEYFDQNNPSEIKKVFYILDITDVHDEANRWKDLNGLERPVLIDKNVENEIKKTFELKEKFRSTRLLAYIINKNIRNFKKKVRKFFYESTNEIDPGTFWGKFTHTPKDELRQDEQYKKLWPNDENFGLKKIEKKISEISKLLLKENIDFYIVIHPWRETLELGQDEFNWEGYAQNLCLKNNCKKMINFFNEVRLLQNSRTDWKEMMYFRLDLHHTKYGNTLYADHIFKESFK
mgnify:CR=1 FL=1|tara:strand:+ start:927 stop:2072 length:1146 start_codon:yes stop_codon:yes gene_type:complete